jgi:hypothetical protein
MPQNPSQHTLPPARRGRPDTSSVSPQSRDVPDSGTRAPGSPTAPLWGPPDHLNCQRAKIRSCADGFIPAYGVTRPIGGLLAPVVVLDPPRKLHRSCTLQGQQQNPTRAILQTPVALFPVPVLAQCPGNGRTAPRSMSLDEAPDRLKLALPDRAASDMVEFLGQAVPSDPVVRTALAQKEFCRQQNEGAPYLPWQGNLISLKTRGRSKGFVRCAT